MIRGREAAVAVVLLATLAFVVRGDERDAPLPRTVAEGAKLEVVFEDDRFFEGPTWDPTTKKLVFTAFKGKTSQILRLDEPKKASVLLEKGEGVNGTYLARDGRLLGAEGFGKRLVSFALGPDGLSDCRALATDAGGAPFVGPNDVVESPTSGAVYFTDPDFKGKAKSSVFVLAKGASRAVPVVTHSKIPNGLEVSNDGKTLYVADSFEKRIYSYPIQDDATVDQGRVKVFFDPATRSQADPDGMCSDSDGNLYFAMRGGIWVVTPAGESLGLIPVPEFASNVTFGGEDGKSLYVTCSKKVYRLAMKARGR
ncbi:MAG: SMP-30/gluconolactonase/LRE family protein [Planctomycetota bacterium]